MSRRGGFTLIELMFVVVIISILAGIAYPAFYKMRERAREASVKSSAHIVQLAAEDFATQNAGRYPVDDTSALPNGDTILDLVPTLVPAGIFNPFDRTDATPIIWDGPADAEGRIGYDTSSDPGVQYVIDCQGAEGVVILTLSNGR